MDRQGTEVSSNGEAKRGTGRQRQRIDSLSSGNAKKGIAVQRQSVAARRRDLQRNGIAMNRRAGAWRGKEKRSRGIAKCRDGDAERIVAKQGQGIDQRRNGRDQGKPMIRHKYNELFQKWWSISPMRGCKADAEREWLKKDITADDMDFMVDAIRWQMEEYLKQNDDWRYFPHLYRWIRDKHYDNEKPRGKKDCDCGAPFAEGHKYSMIEGVKKYKCPTCRS